MISANVFVENETYSVLTCILLPFSKAQGRPNEFFPRRTLKISPFMLHKNFPLLKPLNFGEAAISPVLMPLAKHHIAAKSCNNLSHHNIYTTPNLLNTKSTMYIFKGAHLASTLVNFFQNPGGFARKTAAVSVLCFFVLDILKFTSLHGFGTVNL